MSPNSSLPILSLITFAPLAGALLVCAAERQQMRIKVGFTDASLVSLLLSRLFGIICDPNAGLMLKERSAWIPAMKSITISPSTGLSMRWYC